MSPKRFRVAFSFAGEKRDFVRQVADILARRFGESAILYDKFHEAEFAQPNLAFDLPDLYRKESDLIVAVFCPDYGRKEWCGLEWRAIFGLIKEGQTKTIMLTRFGHVEGKGLHGLAGFIELDRKTPAQAAKLIIERLKLNGVDTTKRPHSRRPAAPAGRAILPPNNLPRLPSFFGRTEELKKIVTPFRRRPGRGARSLMAPAASAKPRSPSAPRKSPRRSSSASFFSPRKGAS